MTNVSPNDKPLCLWTIYENPLDYPPGTYVARKFELDRPTEHTFCSTDLNSVREWVIEQCLKTNHCYPFRMERSEHDQPHIMETWL